MPTPDACEEERELRSAVLAGGAAAWRVLFERHFAGLYSYVWARSGRDRGWTEDILQETWLVAARDMRRFEPARGTFAGWLKGIAENQLRNRCRGETRRRALSLAETDDQIAAREGDVARTELNEEIALTFAELPTRYQDVLRAKYEHQLPTAEIAKRHGATAKSIESLLGRARAAFREAYERLCGETRVD